MIIIYRFDRLTRSLADIARLEISDAQGVLSVSVKAAVQHHDFHEAADLNVIRSFDLVELESPASVSETRWPPQNRTTVWMGGRSQRQWKIVVCGTTKPLGLVSA
jgi:hypothetical protein